MKKTIIICAKCGRATYGYERIGPHKWLCAMCAPTRGAVVPLREEKKP